MSRIVSEADTNQTTKQNAHLQEMVKGFEIKSLLRFCGSALYSLFSTGIAKSSLQSPYKQIFHLLGLMLATPAIQARDIDQSLWRKIEASLNDVFDSYMWAFFPSEKGKPTNTEDWHRVRDVSMPAFLNYFNTMTLAYREQIIHRIQTWFSPFNNLIKESTGLDIERQLSIIFWIEEELQRGFDRFYDARDAFKSESAKFDGKVAQTDLTRQTAQERIPDHSVFAAKKSLDAAIDQLYIVEASALHAAFPDESEAFVKQFAARRGEYPEYFYPTEENPAETHPLFIADDGTIFCPASRMLLLALMRQIEKFLRTSSEKARFFKHRDLCLENQTADVLEAFPVVDKRVFRNVCETPEGNLEHDLLIQAGRTFLVVECKATAQKAPFRDPEKAYMRIRHDFRGDGGIQKAYDQAERLRKILLSDGTKQLWDHDGNEIFHEDIPAQEVFCLCVTADSFGPIAANLSLLLERDQSNPYPWVVSVFDLETVLHGFLAKRRAFEDFLLFLRQRTELHGKVFASDELEVVGSFLQFGSFERYWSDVEGQIVLGPDMSDIFDEIYYAEHGQPISHHSKIGKLPTMIDVGEELRRKEVSSRRNLTRMKKIGRNQKCPCGSGKKYKRCHGAQ
jgi:hypothetical protein